MFTTCEWILSSSLQSSCKVWQRTSRWAQWLTQSWFQGKGRKSLRSWRWSQTRSSLGIAQTLRKGHELKRIKKTMSPKTAESPKKRLTTAISLSNALYFEPSWIAFCQMSLPNIIHHLFLNTGGKDLIRGHGVKGVFIPQGTLQATNVILFTVHRSIGCFHCGLQLQSSRWGVKATKRTQIEVSRVTLPEKY